jgi:uncharacterized membrane protein
MNKSRLEAFSDGVIAIIITIMVLELRAPESGSLSALKPLWSGFMSYILSFLMVAIYWNNHHHLIHTVKKVSATILWANIHLLFWLSMIPFVTSWSGKTQFSAAPVASHGLVMLFCGFAYSMLQKAIIASHGDDSVLKRAIGADFKGKMSLFGYIIGIGACFFMPLAGFTLYVLIGLMWFIPDRRIERNLD